ncbi:hypothetical protein AB0J28_07580 [Streptosporangium canum]|uniref:hypothetical protein n=1 Tax=Streptosporangium canum TaxID=324952 RepID=UPI0034151BDE
MYPPGIAVYPPGINATGRLAVAVPGGVFLAQGLYLFLWAQAWDPHRGTTAETPYSQAAAFGILLISKDLASADLTSDAGKRTVVILELIIGDPRAHVRDFTQAGDRGPVFAEPDDGPLRNADFIWCVWDGRSRRRTFRRPTFMTCGTRRHPGRERRGVHPEADGADGALQYAGGDDLSALDGRAAAEGGEEAR